MLKQRLTVDYTEWWKSELKLLLLHCLGHQVVLLVYVGMSDFYLLTFISLAARHFSRSILHSSFCFCSSLEAFTFFLFTLINFVHRRDFFCEFNRMLISPYGNEMNYGRYYSVDGIRVG